MSTISTVGTWLVVIGIVIASWQFWKLHDKEIVVGKVTALERYGTGGSSGRGGQTYNVVASFQDRDGVSHTYRAKFGVPSTGFEVGDPIRIYFDPKNVAECGVVSFGYRFGVAWIFVVLGLSCWLLPLGWQLGNSWLEHLIPTTISRNPF